MPDPAAEPTAQDIEDAAAKYLTHHDLAPGEVVSQVVTLAEVVCYHDGGCYHEGGPPSYRRIRITDPATHPGALESLVWHTAQDLSAEQHPAPDASSGRMRVQRRGR